MIPRIKNKKNAIPKLAAIALVMSLSCIGTAQAITVFSENFEGYTSFPDIGNTLNKGIPMTSENAQEAWYAARIQTGSGTIDSDLAVLKSGGGSNSTHVGQMEDDAGLLFKLNTTNLDSITLAFNWATTKVGSTDRLVVGYHIGSISGFGPCTGNGEAGCYADLRAASTTPLPWYITETGSTLSGNWAQLMSGTSPVTVTTADWQSASFLLPNAVENNTEVWFAFWLNDGNNDFGLLDNVLVTATLVPEADVWAMLLAGLGMVGFSASRRKQNFT